MLCSPAEAVMRPAAPSLQSTPLATGRPPRLVEPPVPVRRRDPLGLAPRQHASTTGCGHGRYSSRPARVFGSSTPTLRSIARTSAGFRRSTVGPAPRCSAERAPSSRARCDRSASASPSGAGPIRGGHDPLCLDHVERQSPRGKLGAQELGRRLRPRQSSAPDQDRSAPPVFAAARPPRSAPTAPTSQPDRATGPSSPTRPLRTQVPVRSNGLLRVVRLAVPVALPVEQPELTHRRHGVGGKTVQPRPRFRYGRPPSAVATADAR